MVENSLVMLWIILKEIIRRKDSPPCNCSFNILNYLELFNTVLHHDVYRLFIQIKLE